MKWEIPVSIFCWGELMGFWLSEVTLSHPGGSQTGFFTFQDEIFPQTDRPHFSLLKMTVVKPFSKLTNYFLTVWGIFLALFILWISLNVCRFFCAPVCHTCIFLALLQKCTNFYWISPILCPDLWTLLCIVDSIHCF